LVTVVNPASSSTLAEVAVGGLLEAGVEVAVVVALPAAFLLSLGVRG
jgi:hypothetical protein